MAFDVPTLALTCGVLLGAGYVVLAALSLVPALAPAARGAWPILMTETLIVGVAAGAIWAGGPLLAAALALLALRAGYEAARVVAPGAGRSGALAFGGALAAIGLGAALLPLAWVAGAAALLLAMGIAAVRVMAAGAPRAALELALFPGLPLVVFTAAGASDDHARWLLAAFILVETFDSYALLGGKLCGRRPAFPVLSPKKTVEGLAIGAAMLMLTAAGAGALLTDVTVAEAALAAVFAGALTVAGDLAASRLKRRAGVKDFPAVLPHQGGLLDIADAWIAAGAGLSAAAALGAAL